jgi:hypothetical protein
VSIKVNESVKTRTTKQKKPPLKSHSQTKQAPPPVSTVPDYSDQDKSKTTVRKSKPKKESLFEEPQRFILEPGVYVTGRRAPEFLAYVTRLCNAAEDVYLRKDRR